MHDIDRVQLELHGQQEQEDEFELEFEYEGGGALESPFHETQELELASELLEIGNEQELEQFLGNVIGTATRAARSFARSDTGQALGGILKQAAKQALPVVGAGAGQWLGGAPGATVGKHAGAALADMFGLELEGLSTEDREFEAARQLVRFLGAAAKTAQRKAATSPQSPGATARAAVQAAAKRFAPGLLPGATALAASTSAPGAGLPGATCPSCGGAGVSGARAGRWVRRGRSVVLLGL